MRRLKTGRRPPIYPKTPGHLPCSSLTHPLPLSSRRPSVSFGGFGVRLTQPFLRFPRWHFCPSCNRLDERPLTERGRIWCRACEQIGRRRPLFQVPFVAMCDRGHIQDFPWREWVHRSESTSCQKDIRLIATGGASLAAQRVVCECNATRTLASITEADLEGFTFLSKTLLQGEEAGACPPYLCRGMRPWLGEDEPSECDRHLRGSLRSASNLYFAAVSSSIYLPRSIDSVASSLVSLNGRAPSLDPHQSTLRFDGEYPAPTFASTVHAASRTIFG